MSSSDAAATNRARQHGAMEYSDCPVDLDAVRMYRLGRVREQLAAHDVGGGLFFDQFDRAGDCAG